MTGSLSVQKDAEAISRLIKERFVPSDYVSFGLTDKNGLLTNAGKLMTDQHTVYNSRMFCTRWNGLEKGSIFDDALDDKEYEGNLIYLLNSGRFQSHLEKCKLPSWSFYHRNDP